MVYICNSNASAITPETQQGWSGGAMVLGKLPVPGRRTNLEESRARACCACSWCGWGLFGRSFYPDLGEITCIG